MLFTSIAAVAGTIGSAIATGASAIGGAVVSGLGSIGAAGLGAAGITTGGVAATATTAAVAGTAIGASTAGAIAAGATLVGGIATFASTRGFNNWFQGVKGMPGMPSFNFGGSEAAQVGRTKAEQRAASRAKASQRTKSVRTSPLGVSGEADVSKKTLLGA